MAPKSHSGNHIRNTELVFDPGDKHKNEPNVDNPTVPTKKKRVAAYARVSTEQDAQQSSYEAQIEYYTSFIQGKPEWEFVGIYADEGISGTSYKKRDGFNKMVEDAKNGKIDLILTKSISRFARNTVDALCITRELKSLNVEVRFEKENISSMDTQAELIFTIMSSIAQEESRSISENVRWGIQRSMEAGKFTLPYSNFLGYEKGPDGLPHIVEEEAELVRKIYRLFLSGYSLRAITKKLDEEGYPTPMKSEHWSITTIRSILSNEKYKGDARLQKTYIEDFLTKKVKKNHGERKQWYIHDSHDAIISAETFELTQKELARRASKRGRSYDSPFTNKLICGDCGANFTHKTWNSNKNSKRCVWVCNDKYKNGSVCQTYRIQDEEIMQAFITAVNNLPQNHEIYCDIYEKEFLPLIGNTENLEKDLSSAREELNNLYADLDQLVKENSRRPQDQAEYKKQYDVMIKKIEQQKSNIRDIEKQIAGITSKRDNARIYLEGLRSTPSDSEITKFDVYLWHALVEYATVMSDKVIVFHFRNGREEPVEIKAIRKKREAVEKTTESQPTSDPPKRKRGRPRK